MLAIKKETRKEKRERAEEFPHKEPKESFWKMLYESCGRMAGKECYRRRSLQTVNAKGIAEAAEELHLLGFLWRVEQFQSCPGDLVAESNVGDAVL